MTQETTHIVAVALGIYFKFVVIRNAGKEGPFRSLTAVAVAGNVDNPVLVKKSLRAHGVRQQFRVEGAYRPDDHLSI
jgi:hypothetical protein